MSRAHIYKVIQNSDGSTLTGASVRVLADGTSTLLPDTLYTSDAGTGTRTNPFTATTGVIEFFLANPQRVQLGVTPPGGVEFFITDDAEPDARNVVTSGVPVSLGTPVPNTYLHVNPSGQIEYVSLGTGASPTQPIPGMYLQDSDGTAWFLSVDPTGHLVSQSQGGMTVPTALPALYMRDAAGAVWSLVVSSDGHLVTGLVP